MDFVFNELCFRDLFPDVHSVKLGMINLLKVCKQGREFGMQKLAIRPDFYEQFLFNGYSIYSWLIDSTVNKIHKDLLLSIVRQPYIDNGDDMVEKRFISSYAFLLDEGSSEVEGLAIAYLYDTISVSLTSSQKWNVHEINLSFSEVGFDDQAVKVNHASQTYHIDQHKHWISSKIGIKLPITELPINEKEIRLSDDHGKDLLMTFSKKLVRSQFVTKIINSLPFNPQEKDFVRKCHEDGKIELVLVRTDQGFGVIIQSTGRNINETEAIGEILFEEFQDKY